MRRTTGAGVGLQAASLRDGSFRWEVAFISDNLGMPKSVVVSGSNVFLSRVKSQLIAIRNIDD